MVVDGAAGDVVLNPTPARNGSPPPAAPSPPSPANASATRRPAPAAGGNQERQRDRGTGRANLELPIELSLVQIARSGAHGIGLLRTEFLFMNRETVPDEDTQTETYRTIVEAMEG